MAELRIDVSEIVNQAVDKLIELGWRPSEWIPCSDALPASICRVLVTTYAGNVGVAVFNPEKKRWYKNGEFYDLCLIIAWQPMPDAYELPESEVQEDAET